jgi:hypothetical protein
MRVPNTGLDPEMRQIIRDGYRLAERLMRDHRDPEPGLVARARALLAPLLGLYRAVLRG